MMPLTLTMPLQSGSSVKLRSRAGPMKHRNQWLLTMRGAFEKKNKKNGSTRCIRKDGFAMGEAYSYLIGIDKKHISCASNPMRIIPRHLPQALRTLFLATMSSSARGASVFAFSHAPTVAQRVEEAVRRNRCNLKPETAIFCIEFLCFFSGERS